MKWQRARIVLGDDPEIMPEEHAIGRTFWVDTTSVHVAEAENRFGTNDTDLVYLGRVVFTNRMRDGLQLVMPLSCIELLAEFSDQVEMEEWTPGE